MVHFSVEPSVKHGRMQILGLVVLFQIYDVSKCRVWGAYSSKNCNCHPATACYKVMLYPVEDQCGSITIPSHLQKTEHHKLHIVTFA